jgi:hypothetical protein
MHPGACATKIAGKRCLLGRARCGCATDEDCEAGQVCDIANVCQKASPVADAGASARDAGTPNRPLVGRGSSCSTSGTAGFPVVIAAFALAQYIARRRRFSSGR